ncbi:MAG: GIY-YIG nuclease family protein [Bacteroidota bacterium]
MKHYYVYILTNRHRTVLYTGVTSDIRQRLQQHQSGHGSQFTSRYRVRVLLHLETFTNIRQAIMREKQIKAWRRDKKLNLIRLSNPDLKDLSAE